MGHGGILRSGIRLHVEQNYKLFLRVRLPDARQRHRQAVTENERQTDKQKHKDTTADSQTNQFQAKNWENRLEIGISQTEV